MKKGASKTVRQGDLSLAMAHPLGPAGTISASAFGSTRTLANPTTQAIIDVRRSSGGASIRVSEPRHLGTHDVLTELRNRP